jgi:hypothetical protein
MVRQVMKAEDGRIATVMATSTMTSEVHIFPMRRLACPPERRWRFACTRRPVTWSAGTTPMMSAATTASPTRNPIVSSDTLVRNQKGITLLAPVSARMVSICAAMMEIRVRPTAAPMPASTIASPRSCATMRARAAPSALRTAISPWRVAVRAYTRIAMFTQMITSSRVTATCAARCTSTVSGLSSSNHDCAKGRTRGRSR